MRRWTKEEIKILKNTLESNDSARITIERTGRTPGACRVKASELRLSTVRFFKALEVAPQVKNKNQAQRKIDLIIACVDYGIMTKPEAYEKLKAMA